MEGFGDWSCLEVITFQVFFNLEGWSIFECWPRKLSDSDFIIRCSIAWLPEAVRYSIIKSFLNDKLPPAVKPPINDLRMSKWFLLLKPVRRGTPGEASIKGNRVGVPPAASSLPLSSNEDKLGYRWDVSSILYKKSGLGTGRHSESYLLGSGCFYQIVLILYRFILLSFVTITKLSDLHWAIKSLSNGSLWTNSKVDNSIACSNVIGKISKPLSSIMLRKRLNPFGDLNLSRLILIAISQIDAILTIF